MIKTSKLTKTVYNTQPIQLYTPSTTSSSGSVCETEPSSISSSYRSNVGTNEEESLVTHIDKLKRELAAVRQAKSQLATLYKVKCKSDLDKSAKITKLRLQFEHELNTFCKQDQKDLVCYLQRQLLVRDQRISELSYDIEQLKTSAIINHENKKLEPIQILRFNDPDLVISTNRRLYDEQERALQRQNIELNERVKKLEVLKHDQPKDHEKELMKRTLAKQANDYNKLLAAKDEQIEGLHRRMQQFEQSNHLETALRQSNIEKLHLEKRLLSSTSSLNSTTGVQQYEELQNAYQQLEGKYNQLIDRDEQLKQKIEFLENESLAMKSTQPDHQDLQRNIERLQTEIQHSIKERETAAMLNAQLRTEITNLTTTNERITDESEKLRTALIAKCDEYASKRRETEQLKEKNTDLESTLKSLRDASDFQRRMNDEHENNKQELKRKQDDIEQFQQMHDGTKREQQETIQQLEEKIHDLERKTELQSLKHEEILLQFESLKKRSDRILPSSTTTSSTRSANHHSLPIIVDSQTFFTDDSAPIHAHQRLVNTNDRSAQIVVAKYSYEPLKFSPNDHPEIELPLKLGEYYLIYGEIDEDGFYDGRNLEGRYGLIPSNFIELVTNPSDLPETTKHLIQKLTGKIFPIRPREMTRSFESDVFTSISLPKVTSTSSDLSTDDLSYGKHVPCPTHLRVEKSFSNSVLIAWNSPLSNTQILGYQVLLDHSLYTTIPANERTRALIENINLNDKSHRISVRTITQRGLSHDQQCTLLIAHSNVPTDLRVDRITQTTAVVSWWPASNEISHKLYVNDIEVQTLKSGIYRFKLSGLVPNTMHRVTIKAKPSTPTMPHQQLAASIEFRTTAFEESIQPPKRIQVIPGPQLNTLLVSWEQLSSVRTTRGYRVLIDGRQVQDITNPLNDHTVLNLNTAYPGRYLTLRTLTENGSESNDSNPIDLDDVFKKTSRPLPPISQDSSPNGKEMNKSLTRSLLESPSTVSSVSTDIPQIELQANSPRTATRKRSSDSNRSRTPTNENLSFNKSDEQHSTPPTPNRSVRIQSPSGTNSHLLNKTTASPRLFIALFDYDPQDMSPNQNSEEELPFKQGQTIKIYGEQDADGFYIGQTENGRTGYVPNNMVSEIEQSETASPVTAKPSKKMTALFDYNPKATSPNENPTDELSFHSGEVITIHGTVHEDGFYSGELSNGKKGLVPSNYLKELPEETENETKRTSFRRSHP